MDELHEQTVNLLSFQQLPKKIFDTQVAFNMVARYGEQSAPPLAAVERRVLKHYERIAGKMRRGPRCFWCRPRFFMDTRSACILNWRSRWTIEALAEALAGDHVTITGLAEESPSNVNAAGQGDILVSLSPTRILPTGCGCGRQPTTCESPRLPRWSAPRTWQPRARKERSNERAVLTVDVVAGDSPARSLQSNSLQVCACLRFCFAQRTACGYHTAGHAVALPENVQTIAIPAFVNQTQTYKIEQKLTAAVVREMVTRTHYHVSERSRAILPMRPCGAR